MGGGDRTVERDVRREAGNVISLVLADKTVGKPATGPAPGGDPCGRVFQPHLFSNRGSIVRIYIPGYET